MTLARFQYVDYDSLHKMAEVIYAMWILQMRFKLKKGKK